MADDKKLKGLIEELGVEFDGDELSLTPETLDAVRSQLDLPGGELSDSALERLLRGSAIMGSIELPTAEEHEHLAQERGVCLAVVDNSDLDALLKTLDRGVGPV